MTCKEVNEFLMAYLDAELPDAARLAFEAHLSECSSCSRYLDQYRRTVQLGREGCAPGDAPADHHIPSGLLNAIRSARVDAGIGTK
jgi:anti-sigma factor RsiW